MEKFRLFLDNLGIRAKMWNFMFEKWRRGEENLNHKKKLAPPAAAEINALYSKNNLSLVQSYYSMKPSENYKNL